MLALVCAILLGFQAQLAVPGAAAQAGGVSFEKLGRALLDAADAAGTAEYKSAPASPEAAILRRIQPLHTRLRLGGIEIWIPTKTIGTDGRVGDGMSARAARPIAEALVALERRWVELADLHGGDPKGAAAAFDALAAWAKLLRDEAPAPQDAVAQAAVERAQAWFADPSGRASPARKREFPARADPRADAHALPRRARRGGADATRVQGPALERAGPAEPGHALLPHGDAALAAVPAGARRRLAVREPLARAGGLGAERGALVVAHAVGDRRAGGARLVRRGARALRHDPDHGRRRDALQRRPRDDRHAGSVAGADSGRRTGGKLRVGDARAVAVSRRRERALVPARARRARTTSAASRSSTSRRARSR